MTEPLQLVRAALGDRYVVERELGHGGMATVYLAQDVRHHRQVAVKVLRPELVATIGAERFLREIETAARLQHPHILSIHDSGEAAGCFWFTMPYVEGESLRDRLVRQRQLPLDDALRITAQAALALDFAHRHGVIHRDIKPENILLCDGEALVADFGIARPVGRSTPDDNLTETGVVVGTPAYMSPEQCAGDRELDARADIYSLGVVLYEMLAGELPFTGPSPQALQARRLAEAPRSLRQTRETIPEAVEEAVFKSLAKAPADRFQSAADFARALDMHAAAPPGPDTTRASRARGPRRRLSWVAAAAALVLGGFAALLRWGERGKTMLDPTLVVIAPFDVVQPSLSLWHEGLLDLLARNLDGAGPLRTVSPTVVVRRWRGRADRASAAALAASTGAGLAVYGTLVQAGADSVRLSASLLDAARSEVVSDLEVRGSAQRMDQLADSLTFRVLRDLALSRPIGAARSIGLGSHSLPALRAFLRGEQFFRRTEWDSARTSYERAISLDTAFALAYWRLGTIRGWQNGIGDSLSHAYSYRAASLNQGLPPRESLLIACDSLMSTVRWTRLPDAAARDNLGRLFRTAEQVAASYPLDPEAWVALGEARYHFGGGLGISAEMMLGPFDRAVTLDSSYAPAYIHLVELAVRLGNRQKAHRYAAQFLALRPGGDQRLGIRVTDRLLRGRSQAREVARLLDSIPDDALHSVWTNFWLAPDSAEVGIALARRLAERSIPEEVWFGDSIVRYGMHAAELAYRGHLRDAAGVVSAHPRLWGWALFTELALAGATPADVADAYYEQRLRRIPLWSRSEDPLQVGLVLGPVWWAARGDSIKLKQYVEHLRKEAQATTAIAVGAIHPHWLAAAEGYLALARGDTASALARFRALPDSTGPVWFERLTLARLLTAKGQDREALAVLDREFPFPIVTASHGIWALERARLAEKLGEREKAKYWYGYVAALWRHGDPELQQSVTEAREALGRLTEES